MAHKCFSRLSGKLFIPVSTAQFSFTRFALKFNKEDSQNNANMTNCKVPLTKDCSEDNGMCTTQEPTATVIPENVGKKISIVLPSKCPAVTIARQREEEAFKIFAKSLQLYKPEEVMFSFNGGKDCTVVLFMLHKFFKNNALKHIKIPVLFIETEDNFPEIERFVDESTEFYDINLIKRKGNIKEVLTDVIKEMPHIKAVFMGNRRTDPYCGDLQLMQPTDPGWPPLMRINPILDWSYGDVWTYIFVYKVPYCILYELGYTSIGNRNNTIPNPNLRNMESGMDCGQSYKPAYMLADDSMERAGRS